MELVPVEGTHKSNSPLVIRILKNSIKYTKYNNIGNMRWGGILQESQPT